MNVEQYAKDRDAAIIDAVMNDKWDKARQFCKKYDAEIPENETVFKVGIYKAAQYCVNIPEEVRVKAMRKCLTMGFSPLIRPFEGGNNDTRRSNL